MSHKHTVSFKHEGYSGLAFYEPYSDAVGGYYHGYVSGTRYPVEIRGTTEEEVEADFKNRVEEYLDNEGASR